MGGKAPIRLVQSARTRRLTRPKTERRAECAERQRRPSPRVARQNGGRPSVGRVLRSGDRSTTGAVRRPQHNRGDRSTTAALRSHGGAKALSLLRSGPFSQRVGRRMIRREAQERHRPTDTSGGLCLSRPRRPVGGRDLFAGASPTANRWAEPTLRPVGGAHPTMARLAGGVCPTLGGRSPPYAWRSPPCAGVLPLRNELR